MVSDIKVSDEKSSDSRRIIQSEEITFEDFTKHLDNWKIPSISQSQIYKKSKYDIFKTDFTIKTEERDIQLTKPFENNIILGNSDGAFFRPKGRFLLQKYIVKLSLVFSDDFKLDTIALFDTGADLNCIKEGIVPSDYDAYGTIRSFGCGIKTSYKNEIWMQEQYVALFYQRMRQARVNGFQPIYGAMNSMISDMQEQGKTNSVRILDQAQSILNNVNAKRNKLKQDKRNKNLKGYEKNFGLL